MFVTDNQYHTLLNFPYSHLLVANNNNSVLSKVGLLNASCLLQPSVIVEYDRNSFVHQFGNVRITFDRNIRASFQVQSFNQAPLCLPVLEAGKHILEVKYDDILPNYIAVILD